MSQIGPNHAWSGSRYIDVLNPRAEDIVLHEIAVGLSQERRYAGAATRVRYTVAQHSLQVVDYMREDGITDPVLLLCGLLHDAPEYMIRDMIRPVKRNCPDYERIEDAWWAAISARFWLPATLPEVISHYDNLACASERAALIPNAPGCWGDMPEPRPLNRAILDADERLVADLFVFRYHRLASKRRQEAEPGLAEIA